MKYKPLNMIKRCLLAFCVLLTLTFSCRLQAQLYEDFSSPAWPYAGWVGDTANFATTTGQLKIPQRTTPNLSRVAVPYTFSAGDLAYPLQFDFELLTADPTASNYAEVYLWADSANVENSTNALYVASDVSSDKAMLYERVGGVSTPIVATDTAVDYEIVTFSISKNANAFTMAMRVFDRNGNFLRADTVSATHSLAQAINFTSGGFFGVRFVYSASYFNRFYLDNVNFRALVPDTIPPAVRSAAIASSDDNNDIVLVTFNEEVDSATAVNMNNYRIVTMPAAVQQPLLNGT
ncbi:MAG: hypothetical protein J5605_01320 [Bacteroidales bacterium]|nr:hypothetical protein [Bacteroidales bacterium]